MKAVPSLKPAWRLSLSASGLTFLLVSGLVFVLAINFSSNLLFTFCFLLLGVFMAALWLGLRNLTGISCRVLPVQQVHAGQSLHYHITVTELGGRWHQSLYTDAGAALTDLPANNSAAVWHLRIMTSQRGLQPAQPLRVCSRWPLGLVQVSRVMAQLPESVVFPTAEALLPSPAQATDLTAHRHEEADALAGLRPYQAGDNPRRIDWRAMARNDELQVKQFEGGAGDASVWLHWDATASLDYEARIRCLCHWVMDCHQRRQEYGLRLPNLAYAPAMDQSQLQRSLQALAKLPEAPC